jgi:hypothetical protein
MRDLLDDVRRAVECQLVRGNERQPALACDFGSGLDPDLVGRVAQDLANTPLRHRVVRNGGVAAAHRRMVH